MLRSVKVPAVLLTHHMRIINEDTGFLFGAMSDQQAQRVQDLLAGAGVDVDLPVVPAGRPLDARRPARRSTSRRCSTGSKSLGA